MCDYYRAECIHNKQHSLSRRFDSVEDARSWAATQLSRPDVSGPCFIDLVRIKQHRSVQLFRLTKELPNAS